MQTCILKLSVVFLKAHCFATQKEQSFYFKDTMLVASGPWQLYGQLQLAGQGVEAQAYVPTAEWHDSSVEHGSTLLWTHLGQSWSARALPAICSCPSSISWSCEKMPWQKKTKAERAYVAPLFTVGGKSSRQPQPRSWRNVCVSTRALFLWSYIPGFPA